MAEWELPKLHTGVRFPSPAFTHIETIVHLKLVTLSCLILLTGCATAPRAASPAVMSPLAPVGTFYHRVERGQTLWSISQRYGVDLDTLVRLNQLPSSSQINAGQLIVIPRQTGTPPAASRPAAVTTPEPFTVDGNDFIWPVRGQLLAAFGVRQQGVANQGIDVAAPAGTPVLAARGGRVSFVGEQVPGYGKTVILDHGDGYATVYAWNGEVLVHAGQAVPQREVIARVGATGRAAAPSLHFEIRRGHRPQNPFYFLP